MDDKVLLSICIPTYNRCDYLHRLLGKIIPQIASCRHSVELYITDNASTDNTETICNSYCNQYSFIKYIRQNENNGPDANIFTAFSLATGRYVWIFGDDDYPIDNAIEIISTILANDDDIDIISMQVLPHRENLSYTVTNKSLHIERYTDEVTFAKKVGVLFTFISGIIVNKSKIAEFDITPYIGTNLVQLSWVLKSLRDGGNFIRISPAVIIAEENNSGGYRFFEVFAINLSNVVLDTLGNSRSGLKIRVSTIIFLLLNLIINKSMKDRFEKENYLEITDKAFMDITSYRLFFHWLFRFPFILKLIRLCKKFLTRLLTPILNLCTKQ